jgi:hypothetical protein
MEYRILQHRTHRFPLAMIAGDAMSGAISTGTMHLIEDLARDWRRLDERERRLVRRHYKLDGARLAARPGIRPIISSATAAAVGTGAVLSKDRSLRRLAWTGAAADLDRRLHDPR